MIYNNKLFRKGKGFDGRKVGVWKISCWLRGRVSSEVLKGPRWERWDEGEIVSEHVWGRKGIRGLRGQMDN